MKALPAWSWSAATNIVNLAFGVSTGVLVARLLGPQSRGELAEIQFWAGAIAGIGICSLPSALSFFIARKPEQDSITSNALASAIILASVSLLCGLLVVEAFVEPALRKVQMVYLIFFLPANFIALTLVAVDQGQQNFARYNAFRLVPQGTYLVGVLLLWSQSQISIETLLIASWLGTVLVCAGRWPLVKQQRLSKSNLREMVKLLRTGFEFHTTAFAGILFQNADRMICIAYFTHADLGLYAVALTLAGAGSNIVSSATSIVLFPKIAATQNNLVHRHLIRNALGASFIIAIVANLGIAVMIPILLPLLFGADYSDAVPIAIVLCIAQIPAAFVQTAIVALRGLGDWRAGPYAQITALIVFAPTAAIAIPGFGLSGIALALALSQTSAVIVLLRRLQSNVGLRAIQCIIPEPKWVLGHFNWKNKKSYR